MKSSPLLLIGLTLALARPAFPCTAFLLERGPERAFAKSYDWHDGRALVLVNPKGVQREAFLLPGQGTPLRWQAVHSSVTFDQFGRGLPNGGMNDAGLMVEILWLDETTYPPPDTRPAVNALQWVQAQLDRFATTGQVVAAADQVRIAPMAGGRTHYLVCDRTGDCAALEYLAGKLQVTRGPALTAKVLTNDTCAADLAVLPAHVGFGGQQQPAAGPGSQARFVRTAVATTRVKPDVPLRDQALATLDGVRNRATRWQIVYEPGTGRVSWRTRAEPRLKTVDLTRLAVTCDKPVQMLDIDAPLAGDVTARLQPWQPEANRRLVEHELSLMPDLPIPGAAQVIAGLPDRERCPLPAAAAPAASLPGRQK